MIKKKKVSPKDLLGDVLQKLKVMNRDHVLKGRFQELIDLIENNLEK